MRVFAFFFNSIRYNPQGERTSPRWGRSRRGGLWWVVDEAAERDELKKRKRPKSKTCSTRPSRVVPHRSTTRARPCLTSLFGWESVTQGDMAVCERVEKNPSRPIYFILFLSTQGLARGHGTLEGGRGGATGHGGTGDGDGDDRLPSTFSTV